MGTRFGAVTASCCNRSQPFDLQSMV